MEPTGHGVEDGTRHRRGALRPRLIAIVVPCPVSGVVVEDVAQFAGEGFGDLASCDTSCDVAFRRAVRSVHPQCFDRLPRDLRDEFEVLVDSEDGQAGLLRGGGDE